MCNKGLIVVVLLFCASVITFAQSPSPTPTDKRGLGIESPGQHTNTTTDQRAREAKPELVLQTGYNNLFGATRMVFSPDGKLLATGTYRTNTIKLWETATNRKLRDLSGGGQTSVAIAPAIAFSRDSRLIAASGSDNSVTVWDVLSGLELQRLGGSGQTSIMGAFGVYFIGFASDNRLITISDAARVWDVSTGRELRSLEVGLQGAMAITGSGGSMSLSPDGTQLLLVTEDGDTQVRVIDLSSGREVRRAKLPENEIDSMQLSLTPDGRLVVAGVHDKRFKLWDLTAKKDQLSSIANRSAAGEAETYHYQLMGGNDLASMAGKEVKVTGALVGKGKDVDVAAKNANPAAKSEATDATPVVETTEEVELQVEQLRVASITPTGSECPANR